MGLLFYAGAFHPLARHTIVFTFVYFVYYSIFAAGFYFCSAYKLPALLTCADERLFGPDFADFRALIEAKTSAEPESEEQGALRDVSTLLRDDEVVRFAEEITYKYQSVLFTVDSGSGRVVMNANLDHIRDLGKMCTDRTFDKYLAQHYFRNRNLPYDRNNSSEPPSAAGESGKSTFFCPLGYATAAFITAVGRGRIRHELDEGWVTAKEMKSEEPI